ncbi:MAG: SlyX family protein [Moraxellaceae bacterium]|nr:MAG: SlyX family protein [Moraxellaceae bacterium]
MKDIYEELIELQTRLSYQEDTISQLNDVITKQDADITALQKQMRLLAQRLEEVIAGQGYVDGESIDERPPHY